MGYFGVPLIFPLEKRRLRTRPGWCDLYRTARGRVGAESGGSEVLISTPGPWPGDVYPLNSLHSFQPAERPCGHFLGASLLTSGWQPGSCFAGKSMSFGIGWTWERIPAHFLLLFDQGHVSCPLWMSAVKYYPPLGSVVRIKKLVLVCKGPAMTGRLSVLGTWHCSYHDWMSRVRALTLNLGYKGRAVPRGGGSWKEQDGAL